MSGDDEYGLCSSDEAELEELEYGLCPSDEAELEELADSLSVPDRPVKRENPEQIAPESKRQRDDHDDDDTAMSAEPLATATHILRQCFGHQSFRLKQAQAITRLLKGQSCVVVFPTGGGKSLCYQIPALAFKELDKRDGIRQEPGENGLTIVVSPLIALMKDQVDALRRRGISAASLDSSKSTEEYANTMERVRKGTMDIVYCAPERLNNEVFIQSMTNVRGGVRLLAVDESHCISEWGHAFRPDYLKVARFAQETQAERVVCLTATATPVVADDICKQFGVSTDGLFRTPTFRPNLKLMAESFTHEDYKYAALVNFLRSHKGATIVYNTTQKDSEKLARCLRDAGFDAEHFHASVERQKKIDTQESFMASDSKIIVATIAFGMGIDKANIRNVVHYVLPKSLEGYSQEVGRAGRDGKQSYCLAMICGEDMQLLESFAVGDLPSKKSVLRLLHEIFSSEMTNQGTIETRLYRQERNYDIKRTVLKNIYAQLELRFKLLREITPKYTSYEFRSLGRSPFDGTPASKAIAGAAYREEKWTHIDVEKAAAGRVPRNEIINKLRQWQDSGKIKLQHSSVVNVYRLMRPLPTTKEEKDQIINDVYADLESREGQDLDRIDDVVSLLTGTKCFARALAEHFGDSLPEGKAECGECTWCETHIPRHMNKPAPRRFNVGLFDQVLRIIPDRDDPRYLARVAFGIGSPRVTAARLGRHPVFGSMEDHDFGVLLQAFRRLCEGGGTTANAPASAIKQEDDGSERRPRVKREPTVKTEDDETKLRVKQEATVKTEDVGAKSEPASSVRVKSEPADS
ncbi:ATP-dependent DNA helicase [Hortaea werneckii]|nr:ATP-dependent DNA helicase [Hortaea werneckii]KAI6850443.1 ATP-dependent DNA helicase [Hortaea werneckii]KAI6929516.1 ATP-dependent DNA helicase [Hortaea werneckii]KAI6936466.1 ATP-dependent DNA helicase [Hortaea werneckii]KAI6971763.1 ATP-dependent DNA helicase [Hortaea werneckii]